jgi:hypothetical protein
MEWVADAERAEYLVQHLFMRHVGQVDGARQARRAAACLRVRLASCRPVKDQLQQPHYVA